MTHDDPPRALGFVGAFLARDMPKSARNATALARLAAVYVVIAIATIVLLRVGALGKPSIAVARGAMSELTLEFVVCISVLAMLALISIARIWSVGTLAQLSRAGACLECSHPMREGQTRNTICPECGSPQRAYDFPTPSRSPTIRRLLVIWMFVVGLVVLIALMAMGGVWNYLFGNSPRSPQTGFLAMMLLVGLAQIFTLIDTLIETGVAARQDRVDH